ncbi:transcription factor Sox-2-like isoform X1 [Ictalurus furcatus]|uniref:transcription factor Sox-2-like isoform X1 n=1 Tax=Ictalurus furcatus TaxID=66913 RepID=UPI002350392A|nr:transcription factor Sox-2-like isoform X1 [Ictalurus furcatus]
MLRHLKRRAQISFKNLEEQQTLLKEDNMTIKTLEYGKPLEAEHGRNEFPTQEGETVPVNKTDNTVNTPASPAPVRSCKEVSSSWSFHPELEPRFTVAHAESVTPVTPVTRSVEAATEGVSFPQLPSGTDDYNTANYKNRKGYIKKPMNAYMIWVRTQWSILCKANPNASFAEISMLLGIGWRNLSEEQKKPYYAEARRLKQKHRKKFPDCVYNAETRKTFSPEVEPLDTTSNASPTVPLAHPQRSAPQNIPVASPRNSSLQYSAMQTNPMFSVMDMPREVPLHGLVSGSSGQFPGLAHSQVPLSPGGVLVAPSSFPFVPPFYMPRLPFCQTREPGAQTHSNDTQNSTDVLTSVPVLDIHASENLFNSLA